ncbi:MAG TPA: haloacid dehalogenase type II [Ktedonobacteraceae bacterium]|jgi:2-haloalkanoic acid dehalogenase type II|nr:haloacid dehalogenase type II [Ktedonobacteraceae bacterium]
MIALPKAITFDCYGTLIDWEKGIQQFFAESLSMKGYGTVSPRTLQEDWEEIQFRYIQEKYRPYRQVLADTLRMTFAQYSIPTSPEEVDEFVESMGYWKPFPDTREAIIELQKLVKVVLITNTDDEIIAQTEQTIGVKFDDIITAEQAKAYKPAYEGFLLARERLGLKVKEIWHAGFGFKYDIVPAKKLGYTTVWVNRQGWGRPSRVKETFMVGDMRTLAYLVKGVASDL